VGREVEKKGVGVGTAHMSWIDTPLVRDAKSDLGSFREMLEALPPPLGETTSVDACVKAFVAGLAGRKRRVYVPGWVRVLGWIKPLITSPLGERESLKQAQRLLPQMDAEVAALGRSTSARNVAMEDAAVSPR
jgi:NAD(P)-dependent dehydrogenase (short-subunit alcohol dehydrogenase family)